MIKSKSLKHLKKLKLLIALAIIFILGPTFYFRFIRPNSAKAGWYNDSWAYRKAVTVANSSGSALTDFQVSISVGTSAAIVSGKMKSDCSDIRITDIQGNVLPHWIQTDPGCNNDNTVVWTKVPSIPTSGATLYIYYGNQTAANVSDGKKVFLLFDDFNDSSLSSLWTRNETTSGSVSKTGNQLQINEYQNYYSHIQQSWNTDNIYIQAKIKSCANCGASWGPGISVWWNDTSNGNNFRFINRNDTSGLLVSEVADGTATAYNGASATGPTAYRYYRIKIDASNVNYDYSDNGSSWTNHRSAARAANYSGAPPLIAFGKGIHQTSYATNSEFNNNYSSAGNLASSYFDDVFVANYIASPPTTSLSSTEEQSEAPIAYWKFDEGQGTIVNNGISIMNYGTLGSGNSAPTWQTEDLCVSGKCLKFDGNNDYISVTDSPQISITNTGLTLSAWIKPNNITTQWQEIMTKVSHYSIALNYGQLSYADSVTWNYATIGSYGSISANEWQHIAVTESSDGTTISFYINGRLVGTKTRVGGNLTDNANNLSIGAWLNSRYFNGFIDEPKIYSYARTPAQIKADYNARGTQKGAAVNVGAQHVAPAGISNGLVGYWKMDENTGTTIADSSGNNYTGTLGTGSSSPAWSTGKFGVGLTFNGVATVNIGSTINNVQTIAFWTKPDVFSNNYLSLNSSVSVSDSNRTLSAAGFTSPKIYVNANLTTGITNVPAWQHIVITTDTPITADSIKFGQIGSSHYRGVLDEIRLYNRALQPSEVQQLYNWAPGPTAYYNFEEGNGTSVFDSSGNGVGGTWNGTGNHWETGKYGKAGNFNGSDDLVDIGNNTSIQNIFDAGGTIETWIKPRSLGENTAGRILDKSSGTGLGWTFFTDTQTGNNISLEFRQAFSSSYNYWYTTTEQVPLNSWTHVALTYSNASSDNNPIIYINGKPAALTKDNSGTGVRVSDDAVTAAIGNVNSYGRAWDGLIDDLKIYKYIRTQKQIVEDMQNSPLSSSKTPVSYYKFDEGYGTTTYDSSLNKNNGTFGTGTSAPAWTNNGIFGKALNFNGNENDYIQITDNTSFDIYSDGFTYSAWIKGSSFAGTYNMIMGHYLPYFCVRSTGKLLLSFSDGAQRSINGNTVLNTNQWYHVAATYDNTGYVKMYINGRLDQSSGPYGTVANQAGNQYLGTWYSGKNYPFSGLIDEVKIYNYGLTSEEIKTEYNRGAAIVLGSTSVNTGNTAPNNASSQDYCVPGDSASCSSPVGEWKFEEGSGTTANDSSGNGYTGTLGTSSSAPTWTTGKIGKSLNFSQSNNQYISTSDIDINSSFTLESWVYTTDGTSTKTIISKGSDTTTNYCLDTRGTSNSIGFFVYNDSNIAVGLTGITVTKLPTNRWVHVAGVYNSASQPNFSVYLDGVRIGDTANWTGTMASNNVDTTIGSRNRSVYFNGKLDEVKIFNYARSPAQIAWDYNRGGPMLWYKFDDCQGTTLYDSTGLNNNATISIGASSPDVFQQTTAGSCGVGDTTAWGNGQNGKFNSSLNFDGGDDYAYKTTNQTLDGVNESACVWIKHTESDWILSLAYNGWDRRLHSSYWVIVDKGGDYYYPTIVGTAGGDWHHVCYTFSNGDLKSYVDGRLASSTTTAENSLSVRTLVPYLGGKICSGSSCQYYYQGQLDDLRVFNYNLTAEQVKQIYNEGGAVRFGPTTGSP